MTRVTYKIFLFTMFFSVLSNLSPFVFAQEKDLEALAISAIEKSLPTCEKCTYFALEQKDSFVQKHQLYLVSTLDLVPPPYWSVAVNPSGATHILEPRYFEGWNGLFKDENVELKTERDYQEFAESFLELSVGKAILLQKLLDQEKLRVKAKRGKVPKADFDLTKVKASEAKISFYAKTVTNGIQYWTVHLRPNGTIIRASVDEY